MILQRLYALARRENLLDDPAFETLPVPWVVLMDDGGDYLGLQERRGETVIQSKKKDAPSRRVPDKGELLKAPRSIGSANVKGAARYFVDTLPRVLPLVIDAKEQAKADASRVTFWKQVDQAADETDASVLRAVQAFGRRLPEFTERILADVAEKDPAITERVTFAYRPSGGRAILLESAFVEWFAALYARVSGVKEQGGATGLCQVTATVGPMPNTHDMKLKGVPGGMSVGVSLISADKPAFQHYGLDGTAGAGIGYTAADGYARALDALLKNTLPSVHAKGNKSKIVIGGTAFLYWTRDPADVGFMSLFDEPTDEKLQALPKRRIRGTVKGVFEAAASGNATATGVDANAFYLLALSGNAARAIVRGYLEQSLADVQANVAQWFADLRIADSSKDYRGRSNDKFPLWLLALATAFDSNGVAPDTGERLLNAAMTGGPVPESLLVLCLRRLIAKGTAAFRAHRMALIKLILIRREIPVSEQLDPDERHPAYVYGRLLAVFEQIQFAALGDVNANVVDKFYGTMSSAPAMVAGRLHDNARNHLRKIRGEKPGQAVNLEKRLMALCDLAGVCPPAQRHSLQDQGRFALGYYHEKAKGFEDAAERKADRAAKAEQAAATNS